MCRLGRFVSFVYLQQNKKKKAGLFLHFIFFFSSLKKKRDSGSDVDFVDIRDNLRTLES